MATRRVSLIIPALNEEAGIEATIARAPDVIQEIIVVDGGSTDSTVQRAEAAGARVVVEKRRGYGLAYKRGFREAKGELIATADADSTYPTELVPEVVEHMEKRGLDFVSCSRFPLRDRTAMPGLNQFGNVGLSLAASLFYLHPFRDICSGMWVFRRSLLDELELNDDAWCFSNEIKLEAFFSNPARFEEYVIPFTERLGRTHNVTVWRTGVQVLAFMARKRFEHFVRSRITDSGQRRGGA